MILLALLILLPSASSLRPLAENFGFEPEDSTLCSGLKCSIASSTGRINQGRFIIKADDTKKLAWKMKAGSSYALYSKQDCFESQKLTSANVVPWIDGENPTEASTIEVFVDPKHLLDISRTADQAFLCASEMYDASNSSCMCRVPLDEKHGQFLARFPGLLMTLSSIADAQLSAERLCDSLWVPEGATLVLIGLALCNVLVCGEALVAWFRAVAQKPDQGHDVKQELVLQTSPNALLYSATSSAVGFTMLTITMQALATRIAIQSEAPEPMVKCMIWASLAFGICGIWRFYMGLCRNQLVQSCLSSKVCIFDGPSSQRTSALLAGATFGYMILIGGCLSGSVKTCADAIKAIAFIVSSMVGPVMGILKTLRNSLEAEQAAVQYKLRIDKFKDVMQAAGSNSVPDLSKKEQSDQFQGWAYVQWADMISSFRQGLSLKNMLGRHGGVSPPDQGGEVNIPHDIGWHRLAVHRLTGSCAGFLVLPSCFLALSLIVLTTLSQAVSYHCSRGELQMLEIPGGHYDFNFARWQDHYVIDSDVSYRQAVLVATAASSGRRLRFELGQGGNHEQQNDAQQLVAEVKMLKLQQMKIPRVANISVQSLRQSQHGTKYSLQFASKLTLPILVHVSNAGSDPKFQRCISAGALSESEASIPPDIGDALNISVVFADYVVGPPYIRDKIDHTTALGLETTWTAFEPYSDHTCKPNNLQCCEEVCFADVNCLKAFLGDGGCYFAYHHHERQVALCEKSQAISKRLDTNFKVDLYGCSGGSALCPSRNGSFMEVRPDWRGGFKASLKLDLSLETGQQMLPVRHAIELRRGVPVVKDVLVHISGNLLNSEEEFVQIDANGTVTEDGNIVVKVSEYDPFAFSALRLVVVPILWDRKFQVRWAAAEPPDALPRFVRCEQSFALRQRYKVCGGPGKWATQPISLNLTRWFSGFIPTFTVVPTDGEEEGGLLWPSSISVQHISIRFVRAGKPIDGPIVWSAAKEGCNLFNKYDGLPQLKVEMTFALQKSADGLCTLLLGGCMSSHKSQMCGILHDSFNHEGWNGQGIAGSEYVQLLSCFQPFSKNSTCSDPGVDKKWFGPFHWQLRPDDKQNMFVFNYIHDSYLRNGVVASLESSMIKISQEANHESKPQYWEGFLLQILEMCRDIRSMESAKSWLMMAFHTGSVEVVQHIKMCFDLKNVTLKADHSLANAAWDGLQQSIGARNFNASLWLLSVANCSVSDMPAKLVETSLQDGRSLEVPQAMESLVQGTSIPRLDMSLETPLAVRGIGSFVGQFSGLEILYVQCWKCGPGHFMPMDEGFFNGLGKHRNLHQLELPGFSWTVPVLRKLAAAIADWNMSKLYLHGYEQQTMDPKFLSLFEPVCIRHFEVAALVWTSDDAREVVKAFNSSKGNVSWPCLKKLRFEELHRFPAESKALKKILEARKQFLDLDFKDK